MSTGSILLPDYNRQFFKVAAEINGNSVYTPHSVPEINGAPVSNSNPLPFVNIPAQISAVTPNNSVVATANTPVMAFPASIITAGCYITNPLSANTNLLVDPVSNTPSLSSTTTSELLPGQTWVAEGAIQNAVYVNSSDANHFFRAVGYQIVGYIVPNNTITITGDATGNGTGTINITLANTGVVANTYTKVTVDVKGRVLSGSNLSNVDIITYLGYTPSNKAGDTFTGNVIFNGTVTVNNNLTVNGNINATSISIGGNALSAKQPYSVSGFISGTWTANQTLVGHEFAMPVVFPANFGTTQSNAKSYAAAITASPTANTTSALIMKCLAASDPTVNANWTQVGTISWLTTSSPTGTFGSNGGASVSFASGDYMKVQASSSVDSTLSGVTITIAGDR